MMKLELGADFNLPKQIALVLNSYPPVSRHESEYNFSPLMRAVYLMKNSNDAKKFAQCRSYRDSLFKKAPTHPKREQIDALLKKLKSERPC